MSESSSPAPTPKGAERQDYEHLKIAVDVWKHVVSVQMHFNDMEMKIRNLYFTILAAAVGAVGFVQGKKIDIPYLELQLSLAMVVFAAIIPISLLFYLIDRHWYHRLLKGSVAHAGLIEKRYAEVIPEIQLGLELTKASPVPFPSRGWKWAFFFVKEDNFRKHKRLHSDAKIEVLYKSVICSVGILTIAYALIKGVQFREHPLLFWLIP